VRGTHGSVEGGLDVAEGVGGGGILRAGGQFGQPSRASNIITTESPIRTSACPMPFPSGPGMRASSSAPNAALVKSISPAVSGEMIQGVTVP
jgi:hypothetical protein